MRPRGSRTARKIPSRLSEVGRQHRQHNGIRQHLAGTLDVNLERTIAPSGNIWLF
ncbi:MAG: hypothetical protein AAGD01_05030 [Acidobacteriota bacterium]